MNTIALRFLSATALAATLHTAAAACQPAADGALTAHYAVRYAPKGSTAVTQNWLLSRTADRLSWRKGDIEEVWLRQPNGVRLLRVFHADRQVVEYAPGELSALGVKVAWDELAGLLSEASLAQLSADGPMRRGKLGADTVAVQWDAAAALPTHLQREGAGGEVVYERTECKAGAQVATDFAGYGRIDASDFGDMENDPFVRKAMAYDERQGWREAHAH